MHLLGLSSEAECNSLKKASSDTLDAQSTAEELGRDRDMRRNAPMGTLLAKVCGHSTTAMCDNDSPPPLFAQQIYVS